MMRYTFSLFFNGAKVIGNSKVVHDCGVFFIRLRSKRKANSICILPFSQSRINLPEKQAMVTELKISVLSDKEALCGYGAEHGLSFLVEADSRVLFDTGASDWFMRNAAAMGIDLDSVDTVVLSHGHYDHGNGLQYIEGKTIIMHPGAFARRISGRSGCDISIAIDRQQVEIRNKIIETKEPLWLTDNMVYLGDIERVISFEQECSTPFHFANGSPDTVADDSALAVNTSKGLVVISGCAHAGICNIVEQARSTTGTNKVYCVIGGFHLTSIDQRLANTIDYLKNIGCEIVMPSHCTSDIVIDEFHKHFKGETVKTGMVIRF